MVNHSHGDSGWHDHPIFDSAGDHVIAHDMIETAKLEKFFAGASWHPLAGIVWPNTIQTVWADSSQFKTEVAFEHRKA